MMQRKGLRGFMDRHRKLLKGVRDVGILGGVVGSGKGGPPPLEPPIQYVQETTASSLEQRFEEAMRTGEFTTTTVEIFEGRGAPDALAPSPATMGQAVMAADQAAAAATQLAREATSTEALARIVVGFLVSEFMLGFVEELAGTPRELGTSFAKRLKSRVGGTMRQLLTRAPRAQRRDAECATDFIRVGERAAPVDVLSEPAPPSIRLRVLAVADAASNVLQANDGLRVEAADTVRLAFTEALVESGAFAEGDAARMAALVSRHALALLGERSGGALQ